QMYYTRPLEPVQPVMSDEVRQKHEASKRKYPKLNLSEGEYVIRDVRRHPIGLFQIWFFVLIIIAAIVSLLTVYLSSDFSQGTAPIPAVVLGGIVLLVSMLALIGGYIGTFVYTANRFYLTNESVIQNIQESLFSNREQTVSLGNIEDASYTKQGIIQSILNYGQIRLSTQGDETTYRFSYASEPAKQVSDLNNAVEAFKNGRPVAHH
ncbi:MAG: PH domain-containing protein, partial [Candidatus Saccharimonadales bacterium]